MEYRTQPRILMRDLDRRARLTAQDRQQTIAAARRAGGFGAAAEAAARFDHGSRLLGLLARNDLPGAQIEARDEEKRIREQAARQRAEKQSAEAQAAKASRGLDGRPVETDPVIFVPIGHVDRLGKGDA